MEAASRPVFEPLTDLPVEEPVDARAPVRAASAASPAAASAAGHSNDPAGDLIDSESLFTPSDLRALTGSAAAPATATPSRAAPAAVVAPAPRHAGSAALPLTSRPYATLASGTARAAAAGPAT